jgi:8-oxo-dGTP pyrophosphatase MutT (NUDIX family)
MAKVSRKKTVFKTPWFSLESLQYPDHGITSKNPYYRLVDIDGVVIMTLTPDERIVLVRQFRPALGYYTNELPAGGVDRKESPLQAAKRELYEEAGYRAKKYTQISKEMHLFQSRSNIKIIAFLAEGATKDPAFEPREDIEALEVTVDELRVMVRKGTYTQFPGLGVILLWLWNKEGKKTV